MNKKWPTIMNDEPEMLQNQVAEGRL